MIPYFPEPVLQLGGMKIHAYSLTAVTAILVSLWMILWRAYRKGVPVEDMFRLWFVMYVCAMVGAHVYHVVIDNFVIFQSDPSTLFQLSGMSSAGALNGGLWCGLLWCLYKRLSWFEIFRRIDVATYAIPTAFLFGRLGCALAHDHRGVPSTSWIAVQFPRGSRFDLGLIEFLFLILVVALFWILDRRPRPVGFFFGLFGVLYGIFRLSISPLRTEPEYVYGIASIVIGIGGWIAMNEFQKSQPVPLAEAKSIA
jgi:phosphatidylglycerol---prolipoprotein diacylglyceryl transferase